MEFRVYGWMGTHSTMKLVQQFPRQVVLATEPARRRIQKLVERARPQTVKAALAKLDDRFSSTATATNRDGIGRGASLTLDF